MYRLLLCLKYACLLSAALAMIAAPVPAEMTIVNDYTHGEMQSAAWYPLSSRPWIASVQKQWVTLWDLTTRQPIKLLYPPAGVEFEGNAEFTADGTRLTVRGTGGLYIWTIQDSGSWPLSFVPVVGVSALTPDSEGIVWGYLMGTTGTLLLSSGSTPQPTSKQTEKWGPPFPAIYWGVACAGNPVRSLFHGSSGWSSSGPITTSDERGRSAHLFTEGGITRFLTPGTTDLIGAALSRDASRALTVCHERIALWNTSTGAAITSVSAETPPYEHEPAFSPDGQLVVTTSESLLILRNAQTLSPIRTIAPSWNSYFRQGLFSPDGEQLLAYKGDGRLERFNVQTGAPLDPLGLFKCQMGGYLPDGKILLGTPNSIDVRNVDGTSLTTIVVGDPSWLDASAGSAFSPVDPQFVAADRLWDATTGNVLKVLPPCGSPAFSPDGSKIAGFWTNMDHHQFYILDLITGTSVTDELAEIGRSLSFSPDGETLAVGYVGGLQLRATDDLRLLKTLSTWSTGKTAFSPDGTMLLAGDMGHRNLDLYALPSGDRMTTCPLAYGGFSVQWLPDSKRCVVGSATNVLLLEAPNLTELDRMPARGEVAAIEMDPLHERYLVVTQDGYATEVALDATAADPQTWTLY